MPSNPTPCPMDQAIEQLDFDALGALCGEQARRGATASQWERWCCRVMMFGHQGEIAPQTLLATVDQMLVASGEHDMVVGLARSSGTMMGLLLKMNHPTCDQWALDKQLLLTASHKAQWIRRVLKNSTTVDLFALSRGLAMPEMTTLREGVSVAIGCLRGETAERLDELRNAMPLASDEVIAKGLAELLHHVPDEQAFTPTLESLVWLGKACPTDTLSSQAQKQLWFEDPIQIAEMCAPLIAQIQAAPALLEQQQMEGRTSPAHGLPHVRRL